MHALPLSTLSSLLALVVYVGITVNVGRARSKYGVAAPSVTGNIEFEKRYRVQANTIEQLVLMFPALWLCAFWVGDAYAALGGVIWSVGRVVYARGYYDAPEKRGPGFGLSFLPTVAMLLATLVAVVRAMV